MRFSSIKIAVNNGCIYASAGQGTQITYCSSGRGSPRGDPLSIIFYGITLTPLVEELWVDDPELLVPFYAHDAEFDGLELHIMQLLHLLI